MCHVNHIPISFDPRTYTREFGMKMAEELPAFNGASPTIASACHEDSVIEALCNMDMGRDDWSDAGLPELLEYLYGARGFTGAPFMATLFPG